jgi:hypothetical protein
VGNEAKDDPSKDFLAVKGTETGHEVYNDDDNDDDDKFYRILFFILTFIT